MVKILYLEDDKNLSDTIVEFLEDNNFDVTTTYNGEAALEKLYHNQYDLLLFDVNLPDMNGFDLLKQLRDSNIITPAIFTTTFSDINSLDKGYSVGADDYVKKPFALKELLHRINVILKRGLNIASNKIEIFDGVYFDTQSKTIYNQDQIYQLNQKEAKLLTLLYQNRGQILLFDIIYSNLWSDVEDISDTSLRTYIKNLRKAIGKDKILSIKKQGYKLVI